MTDTPMRFFFDFVDPLSYLLELELEALDLAVRRAPFELRAPPEPLVALDDASLAARWSRAREIAAASGAALDPPHLVPWSRKAHELHLFAAARGLGGPVRRAVYRAFMSEGRDIGRIDVLVEIGRSVGLDATETKVTLDLDSFEAEVLEARAHALALEVGDTPLIVGRGGRLEGFHNRTAIGTFLRESRRTPN